MEFPQISPEQYAVLQCELRTGIILNLDGKRRLDSGKTWLIFNSLEAARDYSKQRVLVFPEIECNIYNHLNEHILTIDSLTNDPF
jgi:hypothetical protein